MDFVKMHGTGNDFVVIADLDGQLDISADRVRALCNRHTGVGADGVIRITRAENAPFFMDYRNADGSVAEMCGNGVRVVGKYLGDRGLATQRLDLDTRGGVKHLELHRNKGLVDRVTVDMGMAQTKDALFETIDVDGEAFDVSAVSVGNPHGVLFVDDVGSAPVQTLGPLIERHRLFPQGANISFVAVVNDHVLESRVWERGVGETLCCGTAACAVAVAAQRYGYCGERVEVRVPGGVLELSWRPGGSVSMTGNAVEVFRGSID